jgi:O-antigen ligase
MTTAPGPYFSAPTNPLQCIVFQIDESTSHRHPNSGLPLQRAHFRRLPVAVNSHITPRISSALATFVVVGALSYGSFSIAPRGLPHGMVAVGVLLGTVHLLAHLRTAPQLSRYIAFGAYLALTLLASSIVSTRPETSFLLSSYTLIGYLGSLVLVFSARLDFAAWSIVDNLLLAMLFCISLQLLFQLFSGSLDHALETNWGRSNYVACNVLLLCIFITCRASRIERLRRRRTAYAAVALGIGLSLMIHSRGSVIAFGLSIVSALVLSRALSLGKKLLLVVLSTVLAVRGYTWMISERLQLETAEQMDRNVNARLGLWRIAWSDFLGSPLLGTGPGELRISSGRTLSPGMHDHAHNVWLSVLQQFGLLGVPALVCLAVALYSLLRLSGIQRALPIYIAAVSFVEPLFEGLMGAILASTCLIMLLEQRRQEAKAEATSTLGASTSSTSPSEALDLYEWTPSISKSANLA